MFYCSWNLCHVSSSPGIVADPRGRRLPASNAVVIHLPEMSSEQCPHSKMHEMETGWGGGYDKVGVILTGWKLDLPSLSPPQVPGSAPATPSLQPASCGLTWGGRDSPAICLQPIFNFRILDLPFGHVAGKWWRDGIFLAPIVELNLGEASLLKSSCILGA